MRAVVLLAVLGLALKAEARSLDVEGIGRLAFPHRNAEAKQFGEFVLEYQREYSSKEEVLERFSVFANNLEKIQRFNEEAAGQTEYGITRFADWSWEEFRSTLLLKEKPTFNTTKFTLLDPNPENKALPDSWDWRKSNIVVGIKDQGQCGSCWSFATTAIVESMHAKAGKGLESLAEQQMVDCIEGACNGGNLEHSFGYAKDHGLPLEKDYPYHAVKGSCHDAKIAAKLNEMYILPHDEEKIAYSVHDGGPTAIGIEVGETFQHYKNGIISSTDCNGTNSWHAVAIIGFGVDNGKKYWIIKNSWGTSWGEKGFANVHRGSNWCHSAESAVAGGIW